MKKKKGIKLVAISLLFGLCALTACNSQGGAGTSASNKAEQSSSVEASGSSQATPSSSSVTPSESTPNPSSEAASSSAQPEYVGVKLYINGVETVLTSPTIELDYGTDYLDSIAIKAVKADGTEVDVTDQLVIDTVITNESNAGNYTATISYGDFPAVTVNVVIKKLDVTITEFDVQSKVEDGTACTVNYEISNQATPKLYYKAKGAEDSTYTETAPVDPGEYVCKLVVEESTNYNSAEATKEFTISEDIRTIKVYYDGVEITDTNNTIEFTYGDNYEILSKIVVKDVTTGTEEEVDGFEWDFDYNFNSDAGTYRAIFTYKKSNEVIINIVIKKADIDIDFEVSSKAYDGESPAVYCLESYSNYKFYYKAKGAEDSTYTETAPVLPGEYVCKLVVEESTNHNGNELTKEFTINPRIIKAYHNSIEITDGETLDFCCGDDYLKLISSTLVVNDVTSEVAVVTDYNVETDLIATSRVGDYTYKIKCIATNGTVVSNEITINIKVSKGIASATFDIQPKVYDGKEIDINYTVSVNTTATPYFKLDGESDDKYTTDIPYKQGNYICKLESDDYVISDTAKIVILARYIDALYYDVGEINFPYGFHEFMGIKSNKTQTLVPNGFDEYYMELYQLGEHGFEKVEFLTAAPETDMVYFKVVLKDESVRFNYFLDTVREVEYGWELFDIETKIPTYKISSTSYIISEFGLLNDEEVLSGDYTFNCIDGYSAYFCDSKGVKFNYIDDTKDSVYFVIEENDEIKFVKRVKVKSNYLEKVVINGNEFPATNEDIYYYSPRDVENIEIEFVGSTPNLRYEIDKSYVTSGQVIPSDGKVVLTPENHTVTLAYTTMFGGCTNLFYIIVMMDSPIKYIDVIRYKPSENNLRDDCIIDNGDYLLTSFSKNDFAIGMNVTLKDSFTDCDVKLVDRENGGDADFVKAFNSNIENYYVTIQVLKDGKEIYSTDVCCNNAPIVLDGAARVVNMGIVGNLLNVEETANFTISKARDVSTILVNGEELSSKSYDDYGVNMEEITAIFDLYGRKYIRQFYCYVVVSKLAKNFAELSCQCPQENSSPYDTTNRSRYDGEFYNAFDEIFSSYSIDKFDKTTLDIDDTRYSIVHSDILTDITNEITFIEITLSDGVEDSTLYIFVQTDRSLSNSLDVVDNEIRVRSTYYGTLQYAFDDENEITIENASEKDVYMISFEAPVKINITGPNNYYASYVDRTSITASFEESGAYEIIAINKKSEVKNYKLNITIKEAIIISIGDTVLGYYSISDQKNFYFENTTKLVSYLGEANRSIIENNKATLNIGGALASISYFDSSFTEHIPGENTTFDVLYDDNNIPYVRYYTRSQSSTITIELYFANKPVSDVTMIIGDREYGFGTQGFNGDVMVAYMPFEIRYIQVKERTKTIKFTAKNYYDDYSYAVAIYEDDSLVYQTKTIKELDDDERIIRITDSNTLSVEIPNFLGDYCCLYILPFGTTGDTKICNLENEVVIIDLYMPAIIFDISVGNENYYASLFSGFFTSRLTTQDNANSRQINDVDHSYELLDYYIGKDEQNNITSSNTYALNIFSSCMNFIDNLYTDSSEQQKLYLNSNDELELEVNEYGLNSMKYVQFYYDLTSEKLGAATVRIFLDSEPSNA